jgi:hypothetical protein
VVCGGAVTVTGGVNTLLGCGMFWVGDGDVDAAVVVVVVVVVVEGALLLPHAAMSAPAARFRQINCRERQEKWKRRAELRAFRASSSTTTAP